MPHHGNFCAGEHDDVAIVAAPAEKQMHAMVSYYLAICNEWTGHTKLFNCNILFHNKSTHKQLLTLKEKNPHFKNDFQTVIEDLIVYL